MRFAIVLLSAALTVAAHAGDRPPLTVAARNGITYTVPVPEEYVFDENAQNIFLVGLKPVASFTNTQTLVRALPRSMLFFAVSEHPLFVSYGEREFKVFERIKSEADKLWNGPDILNPEKNGADQMNVFYRDAAITTTGAALLASNDEELVTSLQYAVDSKEARFTINEVVLYFSQGEYLIKLGTIDMSTRTPQEIHAALEQWRRDIMAANPAPDK